MPRNPTQSFHSWIQVRLLRCYGRFPTVKTFTLEPRDAVEWASTTMDPIYACVVRSRCCTTQANTALVRNISRL